MPEAGLSAVLDAVRAAARTGSFAPMAGDELAGQVTALVAGADGPEEERTVRLVLGCLFRLRAAWPVAAGPDAGPDAGPAADEILAAVLLAPLLATDPAAVPNSVRASLGDPETARAAAAYGLAALAGPLRDNLAAGPPREPAPVLPAVWEVMDALYRGTRDPGWLREASDALGRLAAATLAESPVLAGGLESDRAIALWELFQLTGEIAALVEAATACRSSVALVPEGHPLRPRVLSNACMTLRALYERTGRPQALRDAVELGRQARSAVAAEGTSDGAIWSNLGIALRALYEAERDPDVLREAVSAGREAVAAVTDDDPVKPSYLSNLQMALIVLAREPGQEQLILEAEATGRRAVELAPAGSPDFAGYLSNHAIALFTYYQATGELDILREAARIGGESVRRAAPRDGNRARYLTLQSSFLLALHERAADPDAAERAVAAARDAVALTPRGHSEMTSRVAALRRAEQARDNLSGPVAESSGQAGDDADAGARGARVGGLLRLHAFSGDEKYLDEAAAAARRAADLADETDPLYPAHLADVGAVIARIAEARGDASLLDEALDWSRQAVAAAEGHEGQRGQVSLALAWVLLRHFQYSGALTDLRQAADAARQAAAELADPTGAMSALAIALTHDYERTGEPGRLTEAVESGRAAVRGLPDDSPDQAVPLANLATSLRLLAGANDDRALLAEAVDAGRRAVEMISPDDPGYPTVAGGLARSLESMAERAGDPALYEEALRFHRLAVEQVPPEDPEYGDYAYVLAESIRWHYERTGRLSLLDEAVRLADPMISAAVPGRPLTPRLLAAAGVLLRMRFEVTGDVPNLERAVEVGRRALREARPQAQEYPRIAADLCNALRELGEWTSDPAVLAEAAAAGRVAVSASPAADPYLANRLGGLGGSLLASFHVTRDPASLREAVDALERAADAGGPPDVHARALSNLAAALREQAEQAGDPPELLRRAADAARAAVAATPDGNYQKSLHRSNFGALLLALGPADPGAYREAAAVLKEAALDAESPVFLRVNAARGWGQAGTGEGNPDAAVEAYALGVSLLPRLVPASLRRADREHQLSVFFGLSSQAAAAALAAGQPRQAVELLEQSRCLLLTETIEAHSDLAELRARDPGRAAQVTSLRERMNGSMAGHGRALEGEWEELLAGIRRLPGFERFLLPPSWDQLVAQAGDGPVVMLTAARDRCDAIVLSRLGPALLIPLPEMTLDGAIERGQWLVMLRDDDGPLAPGTGPAVADAALTDILGWLWDVAARPVLDELAARGLLGAAADGSAPRLWWCPTGLLTMFPWQAAGRIGPAGPDGVMDRVVSSFCFSVRSLAHTRRPPRDGGQPDHGQPDHGQPDHGPAAGAPLIVSVPFAPGARRLPAADGETRMLRERFPGALVLEGEQAGAGTVAAALPGHPLVHFACHSLLDARSPTRGGLLLSDWQDRPFTVRDIADLRLESAELAYLSACSTSETGISLLDEAVHVTSAFQLAGFRQVIGTLWPVRDQDAAEVARTFYAELGRGQGQSPDLGRAAAALHAAVRRMRSAFPDEPSRWSAHVHVGR